MELRAKPPKRAIWSGSIAVGLVNVPVKLYPMIREKSFSFRMLHSRDNSPIKFKRVCSRCGEEVPLEQVVKGYEVRKGEFVVFEEEELEAIKPASSRRIALEKFVDLASVDPIYFHTSYILTPDKSEEAYALLLHVLQRTGKAGAGRLTLRSKEYPVLVHPYRGALIATTLHYPHEVVDPRDMEELQRLKEPPEEELELAATIVDALSGEFDLSSYRDEYLEKLQELINRKLAGEVVVVEEAEKEEVKSLMEALRKTVEELKAKQE